jgi:putative ABC transport system substrate-binding protein
MRRREFITLVGATAAAWPFAARAASDGMRRIGVLMTALESDSEYQTYISALREQLQTLGWAESRNLRIDYRRGALGAELRRQFAKELIAMQPDAIFSQNTPTTATLHENGDHPYRVRFGLRSHRRRLCHKLPASGRQHHRFHLDGGDGLR